MIDEPVFFAQDYLRELEELRGNRLLIYIPQALSSSPKTMDDEDIPVLYECLQRLGPVPSLDLFLYAGGGRVVVMRKVVSLLYRYTHTLRVLVPYKAYSSATLLCLAAQEIVAGPLAEFTPIDPQIMARGEHAANTPSSVSPEDIHAFLRMAASWFGLHTDEHRLQVFQALSQRFFPTTLSNFYRAEQLVCQIAAEFLHDRVSAETSEYIISRLLHGYHAHDYTLTREDLAELKLPVVAASAQEERLLWKIWQSYHEYTSQQPDASGMISGVIATTSFTARYLEYPLNMGMATQAMSARQGAGLPEVVSALPRNASGWEIL
jgi:hypothetical protein